MLIQRRERDAQRTLADFADDQFSGRTGKLEAPPVCPKSSQQQNQEE
jgi:hypothetical protein